jgi:hypothetical protein
VLKFVPSSQNYTAFRCKRKRAGGQRAGGGSPPDARHAPRQAVDSVSAVAGPLGGASRATERIGRLPTARRGNAGPRATCANSASRGGLLRMPLRGQDHRPCRRCRGAAWQMRVMVRAALLFRLDRPPRDFGIASLKDLRKRAIAIYRGAPKHGRPPDARALARCVFDLRPDDTKAVRFKRRRELGRRHLWRSATPCVFHLKLSGDHCKPRANKPP